MGYAMPKGRLSKLIGLLMLTLCAFTEPRHESKWSFAADRTDNRILDRLLKKYVNERGLVNYKGLKREENVLKQYLDLLSRNPPNATWPRTDQVAYWINAYNAYTLQLIINHYPVASIKDIGSRIKIPRVTTSGASKFFSIGGKPMSLDNIERNVLKQFNEPRIHFALVNAARSSPRLRNEAYTGDKLIAQLDEQGRDFLNDPTKNAVTLQRASLSKYFDWHKADWTRNGKSVPEWVNEYANTKIRSSTAISFLEYNWALNEQ
ncbi:DUF547 domain-containing protein [Spirosoma fluminis]